MMIAPFWFSTPPLLSCFLLYLLFLLSLSLSFLIPSPIPFFILLSSTLSLLFPLFLLIFLSLHPFPPSFSLLFLSLHPSFILPEMPSVTILQYFVCFLMKILQDLGKYCFSPGLLLHMCIAQWVQIPKNTAYLFARLASLSSLF